MTKLLISYNIIFLLFGNVLFSNIHYFANHDHETETYEHHECEECLVIDNSNNYVSISNEIIFSDKQVCKSRFLRIRIFYSKDTISCFSRAPPNLII